MSDTSRLLGNLTQFEAAVRLGFGDVHLPKEHTDHFFGELTAGEGKAVIRKMAADFAMGRMLAGALAFDLGDGFIFIIETKYANVKVPVVGWLNQPWTPSKVLELVAQPNCPFELNTLRSREEYKAFDGAHTVARGEGIVFPIAPCDGWDTLVPSLIAAGWRSWNNGSVRKEQSMDPDQVRLGLMRRRK